jgi:hypothetical protein
MGMVGDQDDGFVEYFRCSPNDVQMAVGRRIERPGVDDLQHALHFSSIGLPRQHFRLSSEKRENYFDKWHWRI